MGDHPGQHLTKRTQYTMASPAVRIPASSMLRQGLAARRAFTTSSKWLQSSSSSSSSSSGSAPPKTPTPPKGVNSSTSALDYKLTHPRPRPPSLPNIDPPKWSAEYAVTNILYNTPPPSTQPFTRRVLNCLVQNEPGVLSRVSGTLAARGFNIDSLVVCTTEVKDLSRMCIVLRGQDGVVEQARRQLEDLVPVWAVLDYTRTRTIERELLLCKVSILGPEYFEDQLATKIEEARIAEATKYQGNDPVESSEFQHHSTLEAGSPAEESARMTEEAAAAAHPYTSAPGTDPTPPRHSLTPSEALRQKHMHLSGIDTLAKQFGGKIVDVSNDSVIVELSGKTNRIDAFLKLIRPYGILEAARTGTMVMPRAPISSPWSGLADDEPAEEEAAAIDAGLLPPG